MIVLKDESLQLTDTRNCYDIIFSDGRPSVCYTLKTDDIKTRKYSMASPYDSRTGAFKKTQGGWYNADTKTSLSLEKDGAGVRLTLFTQDESLSEWGLNLPFNFGGKMRAGGWRNQFMFVPYITPDRRYKSFYLAKPNGNHLLVAILSDADGWKMDYSPFLNGAYLYNLKLLANFDKAYGSFEKKTKLVVGIYPVADYKDALKTLANVFDAPFAYSDFNAGAVGDTLQIETFGKCEYLIERYNGEERILDGLGVYQITHEGEAELIACSGKTRGAGITVYGYEDIVKLYKKSMDTVDLQKNRAWTDENLCEWQCWAPATLRFLLKYKHLLTQEEIRVYENRVLSLLNRITETDESRAQPRLTIFYKPHDAFPAYHIFRSRRVQEQFFGVSILLEAYRYFKDEKYYTYAVGAMDCLLDNYQKQDGRIETHNCERFEDYTAVCAIMIPLVDMANFLKGKDDVRATRYIQSAGWIAEYLYRRGWTFNTEGGGSHLAEKRVTDGGLSCTALNLLYYCKNVKNDERYLRFAKEIMDVHESWIMPSPICQMRGSVLRWWETNWEGDADGPALDCGHAWGIWRGECNWLYYQLTGDNKYKDDAMRSFHNNFAKINAKGESFSIYNVDDINGGGLPGREGGVEYKLASKFPVRTDSGLSRYVWWRATECFLK